MDYNQEIKKVVLLVDGDNEPMLVANDEYRRLRTCRDLCRLAANNHVNIHVRHDDTFSVNKYKKKRKKTSEHRFCNECGRYHTFMIKKRKH